MNTVVPLETITSQDSTTSQDDLQDYALVEHDKAFTITIRNEGPLLLRLKLHPVKSFAVVHGFDRKNGELGEIEADGRVGRGDAFLAINGMRIDNKQSFKDIVNVIQIASSTKGPRELTFLKKYYLRSALANVQIHKKKSSSAIDLSDEVALAESERYELLSSILDEPFIDDTDLRLLITNGVPEKEPLKYRNAVTLCSSLRPLVWRILLGYLPLETDLWPQHLADQRKLYRDLSAELSSAFLNCFDPRSLIGTNRTSKPIVAAVRKPESGQDSSAAQQLAQDAELYDEIQKDVIRTYPEMPFFCDNDYHHQSVLQRILFLYAKLNQGVKYVQGMNEIVGTIYFVFASDVDRAWGDCAEADTFFCFSMLMSEIQDLFIRNMDDSDSGIKGRINEFMNVLQEHDPDLVAVMRTQGLDPTFFSLRWVTTLMAREFDLHDTIRLWDSLFSARDRQSFMCYLCCAMVAEQRETLLEGDFADNLRLLQAYPPTDVCVLLARAAEMQLKDHARAETASRFRILGTAEQRQALIDQLSTVVATGVAKAVDGSEAVRTQWVPTVASAVSRFVSSKGAIAGRRMMADVAAGLQSMASEDASDGSMKIPYE